VQEGRHGLRASKAIAEFNPDDSRPQARIRGDVLSGGALLVLRSLAMHDVLEFAKTAQ